MLGLDAYGSDDEDEVVSVPPPPRAPTKKRPVKFAVELPKATEHQDDLEPPAKRSRTGAGKSSLLGMLPAPKQPAPTVSSSPALGDGSRSSLNFRTKPVEEMAPTDNHNKPPLLAAPVADPSGNNSEQSFFSFGPRTQRNIGDSISKELSLSAAPSVTEFVPPEPKEEDPYPGYYLLPSGRWAQYDREYYENYWKQKQEEWEKAFQELQKQSETPDDQTQDISASDQLDHAKRLREERKAVTKNAMGVPEKPNMNIEVGFRIYLLNRISIGVSGPKGWFKSKI
jgi:proline-rich protein PRCC